MLDVVKKKSQMYSNLGYRNVDVTNGLSFKNSIFDKVIARLVINHIERLDLFFSEVHRVLKRHWILV
jgi:ubiquinone/menaquinone biosynthesis C-methylase UbiE